MSVALLLGTRGTFLAEGNVTIYVGSLDVLRCLRTVDGRGANTAVECFVANV